MYTVLTANNRNADQTAMIYRLITDVQADLLLWCLHGYNSDFSHDKTPMRQ